MATSPITVNDQLPQNQNTEQQTAAQTQVEHVVDTDTQQMSPWGPNFEYLELGTPQDNKWGLPPAPGQPEVVSTLRQLVFQYRQEGIFARRLEIRRIRQARLFWNELQYGWFDPFSMNWRMPTGATGLSPGDEESQQDWGKLMFVTNFYQAFGLSFISIMSQDVPSVVFYPQDADQDTDIAAAKAATDACELIELNNHVSELLTNTGYFLWTDGKIGAYVRYVTDGNRFGWDEQDQFQMGASSMGEDSYQCPNCGATTPASDMQFGQMCPQCGQPLTDEDLAVSPLVGVPESTGTQRTPKGQEVISIIGGLELNTPIWANYQHEYPYLQWQREVHKAKLKATYPHVADKIGMASGTEGPDDTYARVARLGLQQGMPTLHPGDTLASLVTYMQTWVEPWAFNSVQDTKIRQQLVQLFGERGCYVAFSGETYCEARPESMHDHWRVMHAYPGDGQNRPSVGNSMVQVQERYNALSNIQMEHYEFGIPPIYADPQVLDFDALTNQVAEGGVHIPARARAGQKLGDGFFQPNPPQVTEDFIEYEQELVGPIAQMLTGLFPAVYGGSMDDVKTASAYAQARDQALGRLGLVWRRLKHFYAETMMLAVDTFRKNRPEDAQLPILKDGQYAAKSIRLMDLKGNIQARPEADETFPRLKSQQKAVLQQLMSVNDPIVQAFFQDPKNQQLIKGIFGLNEFTLPGESARIIQLREVELMKQGIWVQPDPIMDDHTNHFATLREFWADDEGQELRVANPQAADMVREHAQIHFMLMQPPPEAEGENKGPGAPPPGEGEVKQKEPAEVNQ